MDKQSQSHFPEPELRECKSCKRELPKNCFGVLRASKDGYNPTCIECRRCIRRQHYHKDKFTDTIYPVRSHNRKVLKRLQGDKTTFDGISVPTNSKLKIEIQKKPYHQFTLIDAEGIRKGFLVSHLQDESTSYEDFFIDVIVNLLAEQKIRINADYDDFAY